MSINPQTMENHVLRASGRPHTAEDVLWRYKEAVDAGSIRAVVETIRENGVDRVQNEFGLTVDGSAVTIQRSDSEMTNRLDERGMSVVRGQGGNQTTMLRADADGVMATDVSVRNYLCIGSHARLEDYTDGTDSKRTACYWREDT